MINIVKDRDLILDIKKYNVILVGTSIKNSLGNGFQHKIGINFPFVRESNNATKYDDKEKLGTVRVVSNYIFPGTVFLLCYITKGRFRPDIKPDAVEYDALEKCLDLIVNNFEYDRIASTIMGVSPFEGGGDKERILELFKNKFGNRGDVTLYDYEQLDYRKEENDRYWQINEEWKSGKITHDEYLKKKFKYKEERKYGIWDVAKKTKSSQA